MDKTVTIVSDEQLLDLYLTAWVAGAVDNMVNDLPDAERDHITSSPALTQQMVDFFSARLVAVWEDPAMRAQHIALSRTVLAGGRKPPSFSDSVNWFPTEGHR